MRSVLALSMLAAIAVRGMAADAPLALERYLATAHQLEAALWQDLSDRSLDDRSLLQAAMIAGGCHQWTALAEGQAVFDQFCRARANGAANCETASQRAELLLQGMHEELLTGSFQEHCYRLDHTLSGQAYNCLTSTILFLCLCREFDVAAVPAGTSTHLFCRLRGDVTRDIHTTQTDRPAISPRYAADSRFEGPNQGSPGKEGTEDGQAVPARRHSARQLDDAGLIALVYYNRGTSLLLKNEFRRAVRYLELSVQLDHANEEARRNLIVAWNSWALELCDQEQFSEAEAALTDCLAYDCEEQVTRQNLLHIHHRWTMALCRQHRFPAALALLENGYVRQPAAPLYDEGRWAVIHAWATWQLQQGGILAAWRVFAATRQRYGDAGRLRDCEAQFWLACRAQWEREGRHAEWAAVQRSLQAAGAHLADPI